MTIAQAAELIRLEYVEMPGLALTFWQTQRLCELSDEVCGKALGTLVTSGFLRREADGRYVRRSSASLSVAAIERLLHEAS